MMREEDSIMIKSELMANLCKKQLLLTEKDVGLSVNIIIESMIEHLSKGGRIEIRDFGNFCLHHRPPRIAHNPKTGKKFMTEPKYAIYFKAGKGLKTRVNASKHLTIREAGTDV